MDSNKPDIISSGVHVSDQSNLGCCQAQLPVASLNLKKAKPQVKTKPNRPRSESSNQHSRPDDKEVNFHTAHHKLTPECPLASQSFDRDPFSNVTDNCFDSSDNTKDISRQSVFESELIGNDNVQTSTSDRNRKENVCGSHLEKNRGVSEGTLNNSFTQESQRPVPKPRTSLSKLDDLLNLDQKIGSAAFGNHPEDKPDASHVTLDNSVEPQDKKKTKEEENTDDSFTDTLNSDGFLQANASSTLKPRPVPKPRLSLTQASEGLLQSGLDINTVASLLPKDRTSTEESALIHILNLESDQSQQNHSIPIEDGNGFSTEQDSGIFDLSLVQQEDLDNFDSREAFRDLPTRNLTPEQRRKFPQLSTNSVVAQSPLDACTSETDSVSEGSQDIDSDSNMGKKAHSLSKGKQAHMVYTKEEFSEEYASPQRSKSLDRKKNVKKEIEKKESKKPKVRKRILSDPSQDVKSEVVISAPITASQEESVRSKRHTIGVVPTTPTQEAGTDTSELQSDGEILPVRSQPGLLASSESNNNQDQTKSKKRLAHSRGGGISPEVFPSVREASVNQPQSSQTSPAVVEDILRGKSPSAHQHTNLTSGGPPLKPRPLSLTNQLQKQNGKPVNASFLPDGSPSVGIKPDHLYERKTEIAVERQVLVKQAAKSKVQPKGDTVTASQQGSDPSNAYTVVTRFIDGEEEVILGALPLQKNKQTPNKTSTPVPCVPKKPEKQSTTGKKFRHYACIEPVDKPVQIVTPDAKIEDFTSKWCPSTSPREDPPKFTLDQSQESVEVTPEIMIADHASPDKAQVTQTPPVPVVVTTPDEENSPKLSESIPDTPDGSPAQPLPGSLDTADALQNRAELGTSLETNRGRLNSSTDTASTVSIPPQSPPDFDYQDLLPHQTPLEHSEQTPSSEPSISISFVEADPAMEQKMVTVSMVMMPEPQKAEVTVISDGEQELNSTDAAEKQETVELQQSKPDAKEESATDSAALEAVTPRVDIPSISSKDEDDADNEEDEDSGVYDASYRHSDWIYVGNNQELQMMTKQVETQAGASKGLQTVAEVNRTPKGTPTTSEATPFDRSDETRESVTTTVSESEFRTQYQSLAYRRVHRKTSAIDYQRLSLIARERKVTVKKVNNMFGFRIQYSKPVVVTDVDKGGAAEQAGLRVGDMVLKVNGCDVRQSLHSQVVRLAMSGPDPLELVVGTNVCNTLNLYAEKPVMSGYMHKLGGAGMIRTWKKRWFVLKYDNCLYYYKTEDDVEPLGAIVLCNYTVMKARDVGKPYAFKLTKCKARTYYFYTATEEEMGRWAKHITEAAKPQNTSDIWLDISTHNVGLPALSIKNPDCQGYLNKLGAIRKNWKKRFCVLKDACLYYYKDMDAQHALGVAHFHGYSIQETEIGSKKFGLILKPPSEELRVFYFFADHETDRKRWVASFASSIGRWIQTNNGEDSDEESAEMLI